MTGDVNSELLQLIREAKIESVALQQVCAALIVEISQSATDPHTKLAQITTGLQGASSVVAEMADNLIYTQTIESVTEMAEILMMQHPR